jgi:voltage-dependent calcium channel
MEKKRSGRMTAIPQLDVPEILVDDESDGTRTRARTQQRTTLAAPPMPAAAAAPSDFLSVSDATRQHRSWSLGADISTLDGTQPHPLSGPRTASTASGSRAEGNAFSFEIQEDPTTTTRDRQGSEVSPAQLRSFLDDSVWAESIRRSATVRKSVRRSDWMGRH